MPLKKKRLQKNVYKDDITGKFVSCNTANISPTPMEVDTLIAAGKFLGTAHKWSKKLIECYCEEIQNYQNKRTHLYINRLIEILGSYIGSWLNHKGVKNLVRVIFHPVHQHDPMIDPVLYKEKIEKSLPNVLFIHNPQLSNITSPLIWLKTIFVEEVMKRELDRDEYLTVSQLAGQIDSYHTQLNIMIWQDVKSFPFFNAQIGLIRDILKRL